MSTENGQKKEHIYQKPFLWWLFVVKAKRVITLTSHVPGIPFCPGCPFSPCDSLSPGDPSSP